jgi:GNAT superfamily N-acetyltransferase
MSPLVVPTTQQTYRQAAQVLGKAFVDEPVSKVIYRNFSPEQRARALAVDFSTELATCLHKGYPLHIAGEGRVRAAALIYPPGTYPLPLLDQWIFLIKSVLANGWYDIRSWMKWLDEVDKAHPRQAHYYLEYIGVDPSHQGKGLGSCLLAHLAEMADLAGVGCYLETASSRNLPFYTRIGFRVIEKKEIIGLSAWFMWREPSSAASARSDVPAVDSVP